jgi:SSS family solute:Na+ symporter
VPTTRPPPRRTNRAWETCWGAGALLAGGGIVARQYLEGFPLNGMQISFGASLLAILTYVLVSLLTGREDFNMDRVLHRGAYRRTEEAAATAATAKKVGRWAKLIGFDENFSRGDKWIAGGIFGWSMTWFGVFLIGTAWNLIAPWPDRGWAMFWRIQAIVLPVVLGVGTTIWFAIGVTRDMRMFFARLRHERVDERDDGTVVGHRSLDEVAAREPPSARAAKD